jgi:ribonuclease HI
MKQLNFFNPESESSSIEKPSNWHLYVDGAARNNPGPAGAGIHVIKDGKTALKKGFFLGVKTNNQAEYLALLLGIFFAKKMVKEGDHFEIFADSQLLVRQMNGVYKVKHSNIQPLQRLAFKMLMDFSSYTIMHVPRDQNAHADEMANEGINKKIEPPIEFKSVLNEHTISL